MPVSKFTSPADYRAMAAAEEARVREILERDKRYYHDELVRREAEIEVGNGKVSLIPELTIRPTPEWEAKGDVQTYIPRQAEGTTRLIKTVRRHQVPMAARMHAKGQITDDQLRVCLWYNWTFETAGLSGRVKTASISLAGNAGGGTAGGGQAPMAIHEREAIARAQYRDARDAIAPVLLKMFESIVIGGLPLRRAARFIRCRHGQEMQRFRSACEDVLDWLSGTEIDLERLADEISR